MNQYLLIFISAMVLALIFTPVAIRIAPKIGAIDIPKDNRRMHTKAMPRFGDGHLHWNRSFYAAVPALQQRV